MNDAAFLDPARPAVAPGPAEPAAGPLPRWFTAMLDDAPCAAWLCAGPQVIHQNVAARRATAGEGGGDLSVAIVPLARRLEPALNLRLVLIGARAGCDEVATRARHLFDEVEDGFFASDRNPEDRALLTMLFTDIVDSTACAERLGDARWNALLARHHAIVRRQLAAFRGREVDTAGDGFFATFDAPARAVRCAHSIRDGVRALGLEIRAGIHTGECEVVGTRVIGVAVHVAARVAATACAGQILVSSTVKELAAGADLSFAGGDWHTLKGVSDAWRLFSVDGCAAP